jgi:hypothetical protein
MMIDLPDSKGIIHHEYPMPWSSSTAGKILNHPPDPAQEFSVVKTTHHQAFLLVHLPVM